MSGNTTIELDMRTQRPRSLFVPKHVYVDLTYDNCRQGRLNSPACSASSHSAFLSIFSIDALYLGTRATLRSPTFNFPLCIFLPHN